MKIDIADAHLQLQALADAYADTGTVHAIFGGNLHALIAATLSK